VQPLGPKLAQDEKRGVGCLGQLREFGGLRGGDMLAGPQGPGAGQGGSGCVRPHVSEAGRHTRGPSGRWLGTYAVHPTRDGNELDNK